MRNTTRAGAGDSFAVSDDLCPQKLEGSLMKKSPNPFRIRQYQQRHVELDGGVLRWMAAGGMMVRGQVDFGKNKCEVTECKDTPGAFEIKPLEKGWVEADFTGVESGRTLIFDAKGQDVPPHKWIQLIRAHIAYAQKYGSTQSKTPNPAFIFAGTTGRLCNFDVCEFEDDSGQFPLKDEWELKVPRPPVVDRRSWKGVFCDAPATIIEDLSGNAKYRHPAVPLVQREDYPDPSEATDDLDNGAIRHVLEFFNYYFTLQGRPCCWYAGEGSASLEVCENRQTTSGVFPGHFENKNCFACPQAGTGSVYDLMRNFWTTQSRMVQGDETWLSPSINSGTHLAAPFGLQCVRIPPRALRGTLLKDKEFIKGFKEKDIKQLASKLYHNGHGPYVVVYKRPKDCSGEPVVDGNPSRVFVHPPPGMIIKGGFQDEAFGDKTLGRKGLPGEDKMGQKDEVTDKGCTLGGPVVKVHFVSDEDVKKYQGSINVKLVELETGIEVPAWVSDKAAKKASEYYHSDLQEAMTSRAALWVIPKPILTMNRSYEASARLLMKDEDPIELKWSFTTLGPRVFDIPSPLPEDSTQSLDWALETIADMKMKPMLHDNGRTVPSVICVKEGEYHLKARFVDPGPWLHIEGAGCEETTIVIEAPDKPATFDFPDELELHSKGKGTGYEYGWENHNVPVFNMINQLSSEHNGGGVDPGGWKNSPRLVTFSNLTLKLNVPLALGDHGSMELLECHIICPWDRELERPQINHPKCGPKLRLADCTFQRRDLFKLICTGVNGEEFVTKGQFVELLNKEAKMEPAEAEALFSEFDVDQSGRLDRSEFEQAYHAVILKKNNLGSWCGLGADGESW